MVVPLDAPLALSAAQHGIWLGQQLDPTSPLYNTAECIEIPGALDRSAFEAALGQTLDEADVLQMRFVTGPDGPVQVRARDDAWPLLEVDLRSEAEPWQAAERFMRADLRRPYALAHEPPFRQALLSASDRTYWYQTVHHIALDGFGFSLVARRVAELYSARIADKPLPARTFGTLASVVEEDLRYRASDKLAQDRSFWMSLLADRPEPPSLSEQTAFATGDPLRVSGRLAGDAQARLGAAAARVGGTWADLMLAAIAAYLHRETGAEDVVLGLPVMTRVGSVSLRVPCMAMNIVPLRIAVRRGDTLPELTRQVVARLRAQRPHARYRYEQLRRDLALVGGSRRLFGPVVNIMPFDYDLRFGGARAIAHPVSAGPVEDLSLAIHARADGRGPLIELDANPACYGAAELRAHHEALIDLLARADEVDPLATVGSAGGLALDEQTAVQTGGLLVGPTLARAPRDVLASLAEQVRAQPDALAVVHERRSLSYRALASEALAVAARLHEAEVPADAIVGVLMPRSIEAIAAILGVLAAGCAYLPLDPEGPIERTRMILSDARPHAILSGEAQAALAASLSDATIVQVARAPSADIADSSADELAARSEAHAGRLAYVIYTSGSTGQPNGVLIERAALAQFVAAATDRYGVHGGDSVLQFAPLHFDASVEEIFLTLSAGARLVLRTEEMLQSIPRLLAACASERISVLDLPTAFWHELAYHLSTSGEQLPASVRSVIIGGEAAQPERVRRWLAQVGRSVALHNTYGPTEATVVATSARLDQDDAHGEEVPIGLPLPLVSAAIVDARGRLVAPGRTGELCLFGGGLARGYLQRPERERARFVALDALAGRPRAYLTGDRVRRREDGQLVFVGRVDDELKISGHRIDPSEVESVLLRHPGVREACVVGQTLAGGGKRLVAFVVSAQAEPPSASALREHAQISLLAAAVPSAFAIVDELPRNRSGKIDRGHLRDRELPATAATMEAASPLEQTLLALFREVLGVDVLSTTDDFFARGGQSLQTIQVASRLSVKLGRDVPVALVFRHPTVAELALALGDESRAVRDEEPLRAMHEDAVLPASLRPAPRASRDEGPILLTGATGFVGSHLLDELLFRTTRPLVCLVRADDVAHGRERLQSALARYELAAPGLAERVEVLPCDLAAPGLGLAPETFERLARECSSIYHDAATVSLSRGYASLRATNVLATRTLIELACRHHAKPLHHVSTLAVAPSRTLAEEVPERFVKAHAGLGDGYTQSKWAAERLVEQAFARGLPGAVYRLGRVVGSPQTGFVNPQDIVFRLLAAGIPAGVLPALDVSETWTPVDFVSAAIVALSLEPRGEGPVFNLAPTAPVRLDDVFTWVGEYGYRLERCPVPAFRERLRKGNEAAAATLTFFDVRDGADIEASKLGLGHIRVDGLLRALAGTDVICPEIDRALVYRYLDNGIRAGLWPEVSVAEAQHSP